MAANTNIYLPLNFDQLVEMLKLLSKKEKQQLIDVLQEDEPVTIPEWQKQEVRKRFEDLRKNPPKAIGWDDAIKKISELAK